MDTFSVSCYSGGSKWRNIYIELFFDESKVDEEDLKPGRAKGGDEKNVSGYTIFRPENVGYFIKVELLTV